MSEQVVDSSPVSPPKRGGRKKGSRNRRSLSFDERYEKARKRVACPVAFLFRVMADESQEMGHRIKCATELVRVRYPLKKAVEIQGQVENTITLRDMRTPAGQGTTIDVTPAAHAALEELGDDDGALEHLENDDE